jgi:hypothetical protein
VTDDRQIYPLLLKEAVVFWPSLLLRGGGTFSDAPGLNEGDVVRQELVQESLATGSHFLSITERALTVSGLIFPA